MVATPQDFMVLTEADFNRLPDDGAFEVVDGRAILLPGNDVPHGRISVALVVAFSRELQRIGRGFVLTAVNVFIPKPPGASGELQNRVPDLVVSTHVPAKRFRAGQPPELVIEILSTPRGNVERTEKLDDYSRAGIGEYWIVDPFAREFEIYRLEGPEYRRVSRAASDLLRPVAFTGVMIDPAEIWAVLD